MKYPKEVYAIGNEFKIKGEGKEGWNYFGLYQGFHQVTNKRHELRYLELHEIHELTAITAETLIKLARKKGDRITIDDEHRIIHFCKNNRPQVFVVCYKEEDNLKEVFLRVAKERGYIK